MPAFATSSFTAITSPRTKGGCSRSFPGSEKLRYTIPFAEPHETIRYLREIAERFPTPVVCFGDDGEKFGTWPETKKHVYENGWLKRFLDALCQNSDWLKALHVGRGGRSRAAGGHRLSARLQLPRNDRVGTPRRTSRRIRTNRQTQSSTNPNGTP